MKITKRQLRRIIKEEKARLLNEHAYDSAKQEVADMHREADAVDEILSDLHAVGEEELAGEVDGMIQYDESLEAILSAIPDAVKDKLLDPSATKAPKDAKEKKSEWQPSATQVRADELFKKDIDLRSAFQTIGYFYGFVQATKDQESGPPEFANAMYQVWTEMLQWEGLFKRSPKGLDALHSGKSQYKPKGTLGTKEYLDFANAGFATSGSGGMTLEQALKKMLTVWPIVSSRSEEFGAGMAEQLMDEVQRVTDVAQKQSNATVAEGRTIKITKRQLRRVIREAADQTDDDFYEWRHQEDQKDHEDYMIDDLLGIIEQNPGISGPELLDGARTSSGIFAGKSDHDVWGLMDTLIELGDVFLDEEEDAWYLANSPEHIAAMDARDQFSSREANPHDGGMYGEDSY